MRFLKKASYKDIVGEIEGSQFHYYEDISSKYKEFELYLTQADLDDLSNNKEKCIEKLIEKLKKDGAVIAAIHCPESHFKTCNEGDKEISGNYLSLCEIISNNESKDIFKNVLKLADDICIKQYEKDVQEVEVDEEDDDGDNGGKKKNVDKQIIVVIHEGCEKGCINDDSIEAKSCISWNGDTVSDIISNLIKDLTLQSSIHIALENITPFYSVTECGIEKGKNCGWKKDNQMCNKQFFTTINKKLKDTNIQFGACIDFCHIMVSDKIMKNSNLKSKSKIMEEYFKDIDYKEYIYLYHVSNYGEDWSHGQLFSFDCDEDKKTLETIRRLCNESAKGIPITFEMADGADMEKAALNYEHIMFYFSNKHLFGKFSELLNAKENKELKDFFDNLFVIYSYDKKSVFEITNSLWKVKQIILKNTFIQDKKERLFGVDFDKTEVNLSLVRLKAYVYYTRFCNLGNYLAENYYSGDKCIWDRFEDIATDFGLAMKYFIFNDKIEQCVYTGIQYKFLIDFLPKKESFFRFNDGIIYIQPLEIKSDNIFGDIVKKIPGHISGGSIQNGKADFYSVGKNFVQCLFKYFDSLRTDWSVMLYKNVPINYVDYDRKRYSIQAFAQKVLSDRNSIKKGNEIKLSLDISRFASGRGDGKATDTLEGFLKYFDRNNEFTKEKVASISDEEVLFSDLPKASSYYLDAEEGVILKKICLSILGKKEKIGPIKIELADVHSQNGEIDGNTIQRLKEEIEKFNKQEGSIVREIVEAVKDNIKKSKMRQEDLKKLKAYSGDDYDIYNKLEKFITIKIGEKI